MDIAYRLFDLKRIREIVDKSLPEQVKVETFGLCEWQGKYDFCNGCDSERQETCRFYFGREYIQNEN